MRHFELHPNELTPGLIYEYADPSNGGKSWAFITPGTTGQIPQIWVWNCALATWQNISDKDEYCRVKSSFDNVDKLWALFVQREKIHSGLTLASFLPVIGSFANITNGIIYVKEGQVDRGAIEISFGVAGVLVEVAGIHESFFASAVVEGAEAEATVISSINSYNLLEIEGDCSAFKYTLEIDPLLSEETLGVLTNTVKNESKDLITKFNASLKALVNSEKGREALKILNDLVRSGGIVNSVEETIANILKKAFGELDFSTEQFAQLVADFKVNPNLFKAIAQNTGLLNAYKVLNSLGSTLKFDLVALEKLSLDLSLNPSLADFLTSHPEYLSVWNNIKVLPPISRGNTDVLTLLKNLQDDLTLFKSTASWNQKQATLYYHLYGYAKSGTTVGGHLADLVSVGEGAHIRILDDLGKDVPLTNFQTNAYGVYEIKPPYQVQIARYELGPAGPILDQNGNFKIIGYGSKVLGDEGQTFFPKGMSIDEILELVASAKANPVKTRWGKSSNAWEAASSNGMIIRWYEDSLGNITSFFPKY